MAASAIPASTTTTLTWATETVDTDGFVTVASQTITVPTGKGGIYAATARGTWSSAFTEYRQINFRVNGTTNHTMPLAFDNLLTQQWAASLSPIILAAGATLQVDLLQFNAGSQNTTAHLEFYRIAA